jgi:hypothetical protein
MNPGVSVERLRPFTDVGPFAGADDVVFRQRDKRVMTGAPRGYRELLYPRIWFNGFHPDVVSVTGPPGPVAAPLGVDHSSLVLYAWHRGMTVAETAKLFAEPVFAALGFLDCWGAAKRAMLEEGEFVGFSRAPATSSVRVRRTWHPFGPCSNSSTCSCSRSA